MQFIDQSEEETEAIKYAEEQFKENGDTFYLPQDNIEKNGLTRANWWDKVISASIAIAGGILAAPNYKEMFVDNNTNLGNILFSCIGGCIFVIYGFEAKSQPLKGITRIYTEKELFPDSYDKKSQFTVIYKVVDSETSLIHFEHFGDLPPHLKKD